MTRPPWEDPPEPDEKPEPERGPGLPPGVELPDGGEVEEDVVGTVVIQEPDGFFKLPRKYVDADAIVYRDPSKTVDMPKGAPLEHFYFDPREDANPDLAPDTVSLKVHGEDAELYRVENPGKVDVPDDFGPITGDYIVAKCPDCGTLLKGAREPGDVDTCGDTGNDVTLVDPTGDDGPSLWAESPKGDTPEDDVACADCGAYRKLFGGFDGDGNLVEAGDFVCRSCAEGRGFDFPDGGDAH